MSIIRKTTFGLEAIREPVRDELRIFDRYFRDAMRSNVGLVGLVARYLVRQKGKRVRPILVLLSAKTCGPINESTYRAATLVEILHTATLIHDDVVDDADTRRGFASLNAVWKNKVAVLMGDYLLSRGLLLSLEYNDYSFLYSTSTAVKRMSEGELLQIQKSRRLNLDEQAYLKIISDKTASLFATCTEIGAASTTDNMQLRTVLRTYGENVGMAFQIRDDLLDYLGRKSILGKPTGIDMKEKKLTLPLIYAMSHASRRETKDVLRVIKSGATQQDVGRILEFVKQNGGIDYAVKKAGQYASAARTALASVPDTPAREALLQFVDFVMQRES
jgi:octaprenyl-diphosphate synthase